MTDTMTLDRPIDETTVPTEATTAWDVDPLSPDEHDDRVVVTTSRRLVRMMVTAVDVGARFDRERIGHDAAAWMLAPRRMFDGRTAMDACQDLRGCMRATVVHGLGIGLDADPAGLDELLEDDGDEPVDTPPSVVDRLPGPRLLSAWVDLTDGPRPAIHFCAYVTDDAAAFARRLVDRFGIEGAAAAEVVVGFDPTSARATAFISDAMRDTLVLAAADPSSSFSAGLDVVVEQRFAA